jgi:hypothetical protein
MRHLFLLLATHSWRSEAFLLTGGEVMLLLSGECQLTSTSAKSADTSLKKRSR